MIPRHVRGRVEPGTGGASQRFKKAIAYANAALPDGRFRLFQRERSALGEINTGACLPQTVAAQLFVLHARDFDPAKNMWDNVCMSIPVRIRGSLESSMGTDSHNFLSEFNNATTFTKVITQLPQSLSDNGAGFAYV
jgi:hypothetical protein